MKKVEKIMDPNKYLSQKLLTKQEVEVAIQKCIKAIENNMKKFNDGDKFPDSSSKRYKYPIIDNSEWTTGFWTGMLWLAYEYTQDNKFRELAEKNVYSFKKRLDEDYALGHHDLGFLYNLSCISAYKLTGNKVARQTAISAADYLIGRFQEKGGFIQAWGPLGARENYRLIVDCLLNIPLLYWATKETGDEKYYNLAFRHYKTSCDSVIRDDGSCFHTFFFDPETGEKVRGAKRQGYSDDSAWARGQAWGIYGLALTYRATKDTDAVNVYKSIANFYLNRLPKDYVCYWDLIFSDKNKKPKDAPETQPRDSSSAAIAICGLNEMQKYIPETDEDKEVYKYAMHSILRSLIENYTPKENNESESLILHGTYALHENRGVDEGTIWGDYYYLEALMRFYKDWELYC
ncbi:glucuronyl hydrolase [Clostridium botulinum]|uniref:Glucuronyl hydrolase n=1 Tax=Clostridium botulinum TaxID=1491 RepID=A0A9Q1ZBC8_CLOBO|nr:glycoside hydrolase family 88 protein [Clostridium botulinum]AEB75453.1 putative glucuronyl hydrolase [Clostridium botulinum BKT015925]KEI02875.1 glucuronyl hydrolase [Clostridium botulinum C/D str. Sp77]KOA78390.1 glucuronyl hydrolase [Clostridium botulinum]KOA83467.1 glucuronyl hydrolase [Clostridium botulinum]KOA87306.1 glucuronyl hydrolase [Clostridium botulinum]